MINLRRLNKWAWAILLAVPTVTLSATMYGLYHEAKASEWRLYAEEENDGTNDHVILHDDFSNNAAGWTFVNATLNKWHAGFPAAFLAAGEASQGLYVSDTEGSFTYAQGEAVVSHAYKAVQLPSNIQEVTVSFDWISEGYANTNWVTLESIPLDYMRVWIVPSTYVPIANQAITASTSGGVNLNNAAYVENPLLRHEVRTVDVSSLAGQEVNLVFEWTNEATGWPRKPAAVRNLKIDAVACRTIADLPFVENFARVSTTRDCWTIVNNNNDFRLWKFGTDFIYDEITETNNPIEVALITTNGTRGNNDDWLMTPTIRLTGNQRLRYTYRVQSESMPNDFRVLLSLDGPEINNFSQILVPTTAYSNTQFVENVVDLVDANGVGITGDATIAWHVPRTQNNGWALVLSQVTVEDIPLCPKPIDLAVMSNEVSWTPEGEESQWEVVVRTPQVGTPTTNGVRVQAPNYTMPNLAVSTAYEVFVRAICQANDTGEELYSDWVGPVAFRAPMVVTPLPYEEDFEGQPLFEFGNDTTNQWTIGSAPHEGRNKALHISNGEDNYQYTLNVKQTSHAYKDIFIPEGGQEILVEFDWKNRGESDKDYFKVWLVPTNYIPTERRRITEVASRGIQLDSNAFYLSSSFTRTSLYAAVSNFANQPMRLVFEWQNDTSRGEQPPAAIDNLSVKVQNCLRPSALVTTAITQTTAELSWTNAPAVSNYDIFLSTTNTRPADNAVPTHAGVSNPFVLTNLSPNTRYYVWVRSACSATEHGFWSDVADFVTAQIPGELPLLDDFQGDNKWTTTIASKNKWEMGRATGFQSNQSMYISYDRGVQNSYDVGQASVSHAYRDILIPDDADELTIEYDWKSMGEITRNNPKDYFRLLKVPLTTHPDGRTPLTLSDEHIVVGKPFYAGSNQWNRATAVLNVSAHQGEVIRLVFEWVNNGALGEQPPAAIDNFNVSVSTCLSPIKPQAELIRYTSNIRLSWEAQRGENKWEVFVTAQGAPEPGADATGIVVEGEPTLLLENVASGQYFVYYVRTICSDENGETKTIWIGPTKYSYFVPDMCADLQGGIEGIPPSETNNYSICESGPVQRKLEARYFDIKTTDTYKVEAIDYNPPFPFYGGDMIDLTRDDYWSNTINLGFDFCFFGKRYDKVLITTNGAITFSVAGEVEGGRYSPETHSPWSFSQAIPYQARTNEPPFVNAIFGVMQDLDPNYSPEDYAVNYQVLGTFPCRALVFNIYHLGLFGVHHNPHDVEGSTQTSQIVLYEGTNIIEVHVKNRPVARDFGSNHNQSNGLIGIQNEDGTKAHYPGEDGGVNRNTGNWNASNEAWRFVPNGQSTVDFKWYKDGVFFSSEEEIDVEISASVNYTAKAMYQTCDGEEFTVERVFNFLKEEFEIPPLADQYVCSTNENVNRPIAVDIAEPRQIILANLGAQASEQYAVHYYGDEDLMDLLDDEIDILSTRRIYVEVVNKTTGCSRVSSFLVVRLPLIEVTQLKDVEVCTSYTLPALKEGEGYFTQPNGQGETYQGGDRFAIYGTSTLYIYKKGEQHCDNQSSFTVEVHEPIQADVLDDAVISCENFVLPPLSAGNKYYTQPHGGGVELHEGLEILLPMTVYIYAKRGSEAVYCTDESSFSITYEPCPLPKGFSPNGDGINDALDLSKYGVSKIQIFNRHGVEVYSHGQGYKDQFIGKDKSGQTLPSGTYYYIVISHGVQQTGWLQINY